MSSFIGSDGESPAKGTDDSVLKSPNVDYKLDRMERLKRLREPQNRRKLVLPTSASIPWEAGSNRFASQKGSGGFGHFRGATTKIHVTKQLSESNDGVVPWHQCPPLHDGAAKHASRSGLTPFGAFRDPVTLVREHDGDATKRRVADISPDRGASEAVLKLWARPTPHAKNATLYGSRRRESPVPIVQQSGGRRFTPAELAQNRAVVPRFQRVEETAAARDGATNRAPGGALAMGLHKNRQVITPVTGLDRDEKQRIESNRCTPWLGGQLTLQSQSHTGGFQKPRDVVSTSYYARVMVQHLPAGCEHADSIHHVEFDYYGRRMATAASDKTICIWERTASSGQWVKTASWKKHGGAVWRVRFAHPEFGQVLATCSFDNTVQIYDRDAVDLSEHSTSSRHGAAQASDSANGWVRRAVLGESNACVTDIAFAPHHLGLRLAACTVTGRLLIYDASDVMELDNWNLGVEVDVGQQHRLASLSWSPNRFTPPLLAVASNSPSTPPGERVVLYRVHNASCHRFDFPDTVSCVAFGPSLALTYHKMAVATGSRVHLYHLQLSGSLDEGSFGGGSVDLPTPTASQRGATTLPTPTGPPPVAFGIASGGGGEVEPQLQAKLIAVLDASSDSQVMRVAWNVLGDALSAVHADGTVRIWKLLPANKWHCAATMGHQVATEEKAAKDEIYY